MSAHHFITLVLALSCAVQTVSASDYAYLQVAQPTAAVVQNSNAKNQLIWAGPSEQPSNQSKATKTEVSIKSPLQFKFFGKKQSVSQDSKTINASSSSVATSEKAKLSQPMRVSAGKQGAIATDTVSPQAANSKEPRTSQDFKERLRQLSSVESISEPVQTPSAPLPVVQTAVHEDLQISERRQVNGLVYASDTNSQKKAKSKPEIVLTQVYSEELEHALSAIPAIDTIEPTAKQQQDVPSAIPYPEPDKIVFRPAVIDVNRYGQAVLRPDVLVASQNQEMLYGDMEALPPVGEPVVPDEWSAPLVSGAYQDYQMHCEPRLGPIQALCGRVCARLNGPCGCEPGLGTERVMHAISFVDTTQPMQNFRLRFDAGYDYQSPDRAEYFWARIGGRGPGGGTVSPAPTVNFQDIRPYMEVGGDKFSVGTEIPIRIVDPSLNVNGDLFGNHSGIGDVNITTKLLFLDGKDWQITNLFRTHIPSGNPAAGLGTGHASIEPGFAMRYKWSDYTYIHGDLKYWIPLGGDPNYAGEVLNYGIAMSHVWKETDTYAVMPTFELKAYSFLNGEETSSIAATPIPIDPEGILIAHPGIRWAWDHGTDCGLREIGVFGGFSLTSDSLYQQLIRLEFRWNW